MALSGYTEPQDSSPNDDKPTVVISRPSTHLSINNVTTTSSLRNTRELTPPHNNNKDTINTTSSNGSGGVYGQPQDESNSKYHYMNSSTPLLGRDREIVTKTRQKWIRYCLVCVVCITVLSIAVIIFFTLLSHYLNHTPKTTPLVGIDSEYVTLLLQTLLGGLIKTLTLSIPALPQDSINLDPINVYLLPDITTNWSNSTFDTILSSHPQGAFYAMKGSELIIDIINYQTPFGLHLLDQNEVSFCAKNFTAKESTLLIYKCFIKESGFYQIYYTGQGSINTSISYNMKEIILDGHTPDCRINELTNCTLSLSFTKNYNLVLNYKQYYHSFSIRLETDPRTELYSFVLLLVLIIVCLFIGLCVCIYLLKF